LALLVFGPDFDGFAVLERVERGAVDAAIWLDSGFYEPLSVLASLKLSGDAAS